MWRDLWEEVANVIVKSTKLKICREDWKPGEELMLLLRFKERPTGRILSPLREVSLFSLKAFN